MLRGGPSIKLLVSGRSLGAIGPFPFSIRSPLGRRQLLAGCRAPASAVASCVNKPSTRFRSTSAREFSLFGPDSCQICAIFCVIGTLLRSNDCAL